MFWVIKVEVDWDCRLGRFLFMGLVRLFLVFDMVDVFVGWVEIIEFWLFL